MKYSSGSIKSFIYFFIFLLYSAYAVGDEIEPFEKINVSVNTLFFSGNNLFNEYWNSSPALEPIIEFPFYAGFIHSGLQLANNSPVRKNYAGYVSVFLFVGWSWEIRFPLNLKWRSEIRAGNYEMIFGKNRRPDTEKRESELGIGVNSRLLIPLNRKWYANICGGYQKIYTFRRIHLFYAGIGISRSFDSPSWLKEFLK